MNSMRRRDLLAAFLGGSAALACGGCSSSHSVPLPPGELAGGSVEFGHAMRDFRSRGSVAGKPQGVEDSAERPRVIIVGAGIAGLAAARRLQAEGERDFLVLELEDRAGGKSQSGRSDVVAFPWGAHYVPSPRKENQPLVALFDEMGAFEGRDPNGDPIPQEHWIVRDPESRIFYKGIWQEGLYLRSGASPEELEQRKRFEHAIDHWVAWRDGQGRRAFAIPSSTCSDDAEVMALDKITMADWMQQHGFTSPRLTWYVNYACRDDYGLTIEQTSAWAGVFYFAARRSVPGGSSQAFLTWPAGNGFVVQHMLQPLRERTEYGWAVARIGHGKSPADGVPRGDLEVHAINQSGRLRRYQTKRVIFAAPRFLTPFVIDGLTPQLLAGARQFEYGAWAVSNVHLDERPQGAGFPMCWDNVLYESPSLGYVAATHQRGPDYGPTVLTHYYPFCGTDAKRERDRLLQTSRDDWAEVVLSDLEVGHPGIRNQCSRLDVARWGHAMVRPKPGFIDSDARRQAAAPFRGIHFAHSDLSGVSLFEEAFDHGWRAAGEVVESLQEAGA